VLNDIPRVPINQHTCEEVANRLEIKLHYVIPNPKYGSTSNKKDRTRS
jgi:hypothetical protein